MEVIPAIDILEGKCVRLIRGNYNSKKPYGNPLKTAQLFQKSGLKKLHLIDLEGAKEGKIRNWRTIKEVVQKTNLKIEFGGGIRDEKDIEKLLKLGVKRVILGSLAANEPRKFENIFKKFGKEKIIVDVGVKKGKVYSHGWQKKTEKKLAIFLKDLMKLGVKTIICTDIERDGTLRGPNYSLYRKLISKFPALKIIASGGIRNVQDIKKIFQTGAAGAIIGKAIYEKKISFGDLKPFLK